MKKRAYSDQYSASFRSTPPASWKGVQQELDTVAIPRQEQVYAVLTNFLNYEEQASSNAVSEVRDACNNALYLMSLLAVLVLVLSGVIAFFVIKRISVTDRMRWVQ